MPKLQPKRRSPCGETPESASGGGFGQGLRWEWQLLGLKEGTQ
jgi:hypothetical protein